MLPLFSEKWKVTLEEVTLSKNMSTSVETSNGNKYRAQSVIKEPLYI